MTSQRDRLAAVLHPLFECWHEEMHYIDDGKHVSAMYEPCKGKADFLLARGVRVVDVETLATALFDASGVHGPVTWTDTENLLRAIDEPNGVTDG